MTDSAVLPVLRVQIIGSVTSFRYPHFAQVYQPTFVMPPPATIYGHICSAVGEYIASDSTWFGYCFSHQGKFIDYEHLWFRDGSTKKMIPYKRELLFNPLLTLYLTDLSLEAAFRSPRYPVVLGRSQDLMTYVEVKRVELKRAETGYFEHTLLPLSMAPRLKEATIAVTMPRYLDPRRRPAWGQYAMLQTRALWPQALRELDEYDDDDDGDILSFEGDPVTLWVDPDSPTHPRQPQAQRAIWFHSFVD